MSSPERPLRIAVTGRQGQVVRALLERGQAPGVAVTALGRPALDLAHPETIAAALAVAAPDVVVNAAAYTAVDRAEREPGLALAVNGAGAGAVAAAAAQLDIPIIQLSTDYVFDGNATRPYREEDPVGPLGVYGRSKLAGEQAVAHATPNHAILRTAWVYSSFGANFVKTMLRLAADRDAVAVVADQHGCPTSALDIADAILAIARTLVARPDEPSVRGLFHLAGTGETTWAEFADSIFALARAHGGPSATVRPITTDQYPTAARRPANSRLDCSRLAACHGLVLPHWSASLAPCVRRLIEDPAS